MSKVYIVQKQMRFDTSVGEYVLRFDLEPAKEFGELVFLLSPVASPFRSNELAAEVHDRLKDFTKDDFLLLLGNPCLIGLCTAIAAEYSDGNISLLQWNNKEQLYEKIKIENLFCAK